jgi:hypothetical protein
MRVTGPIMSEKKSLDQELPSIFRYPFLLRSAVNTRNRSVFENDAVWEKKIKLYFNIILLRRLARQ